MDFVPHGIIPAMVTPLTDDYRVSEKGLRNLIEHVIKGGVHGIFVVGTSGEFYALDEKEREKAYRISVEQVAGRVPVYGGVNGIATIEAIKWAKLAEKSGCDAISVLTPMFISPTQDELYDHFKAIADSVDIPMLLYNNVTKTGVNIASATVDKLAHNVKNIVGVKDSSGDFNLQADYIRKTKDIDFSVLCGRDTLIHANLCYGGKGAITACANIAPRLMADIYDKYVAGDIKGSLEAQIQATPIRLAFNIGSFPVVLKESLKLLGIDAGPCYPPIHPMTDEQIKALKKAMQESKLI